MTSEDGFGIVAIVGVGLIGGSLGMALRRDGNASRVIGVGRDAGRLEKALRYEAIDEYSTELQDTCKLADLIVLCTPVQRIIADLPSILAVAKPTAVVTDVGSIKGEIVAAADGDPRFIGSHPMAGSEAAGVEASRPTLFQDATWAVTPVASTSPHATSIAQRLGKSLGSSVHTLSPEAHDAAVAITSHLPHVLATSLMTVAANAAAHSPVLPALSAGSFADATRVAASSPDIWRDVCLTNRNAVLAAIDALQTKLAEARGLVDGADSEALHEFFATGAAARGHWRRGG
ncbi:MAG TPA: prephenate dehydrogenase/arogenate dehydrogenase family protein [Capsulimonadaceae bacterium]|jgi:prephenate dehydrogenase